MMIPTLLSVLLTFAAAQTDLRITDSRGTEVVVTGATIDYGGFLTTDKQTDGIRLLQGDGAVLLKWGAVDTIRVTKVDESVRPSRIELEVVLRNGNRVPAALFRKGQTRLVGTSALGNYSIALDKIRLIVPVRAKS
jgi:hypothetical protein